MTAAHVDGPATASCEPYQALLAVSEAIASHRDLSAERLDAYTGVDFAKLPFASAIKIVRDPAG